MLDKWRPFGSPFLQVYRFKVNVELRKGKLLAASLNAAAFLQCPAKGTQFPLELKIYLTRQAGESANPKEEFDDDASASGIKTIPRVEPIALPSIGEFIQYGACFLEGYDGNPRVRKVRSCL